MTSRAGRATTVSCAALLVAALSVEGARAAALDGGPRPVVVVLPDCLSTPPDAVRRLVAIELEGTLVEEADGALRVTAACKGDKVLLELRADRKSVV